MCATAPPLQPPLRLRWTRFATAAARPASPRQPSARAVLSLRRPCCARAQRSMPLPRLPHPLMLFASRREPCERERRGCAPAQLCSCDECLWRNDDELNTCAWCSKKKLFGWKVGVALRQRTNHPPLALLTHVARPRRGCTPRVRCHRAPHAGRAKCGLRRAWRFVKGPRRWRPWAYRGRRRGLL